MPIYNGKLITIAEYRKAKKKELSNKKEINHNIDYIGKECYWFQEGGNISMWDGVILEVISSHGDRFKIEALNRNIKENPNRDKVIVERGISEIKFDKRK